MHWPIEAWSTAHVRGKEDDKEPPHSEAYGWRNRGPQGAHIGWVSEVHKVLYLIF